MPFFLALVGLAMSLCAVSFAQPPRFLSELEANPTPVAADRITERYDSRDLLVFVPPKLPAKGARALVIVLHGGGGSAAGIEGGGAEAGLRMDAVAATNGFLVAYPNGTPIRSGRARRLGWNAGGGCCGAPAEDNVDDIDYITRAVAHLVAQYGVDPARVFGMGHSNGAMMVMRLVCETTILAAAVSVSGPLNLPVRSCPDARGRRILSIHGALDENVPVAGGRGAKTSTRVASFRSEDDTKQVLIASGADFHLQLVPGAGHRLSVIDDRLEHIEGTSLAEKSARFFHLAR